MANTNAKSRAYVGSAPVSEDLDRAGYEAQTWIEIKGVGSFGEIGEATNILNYDTWDTEVTQKAKGITDAGSPELEVARIASDPGQLALRAAARTNLNYPIKIVRNDPVVIGGTGTTRYNRGLITGPRVPQGRNEDFDIEIFTLALNQLMITVDPTSGGAAPAFTAAPAITGTAEVGEELSVSNGTVTGDAVLTYSYQWFAGGVAIAGANTNAFDLTSAQQGKIIQARVTVANAAGSASAFSASTAAVGA